MAKYVMYMDEKFSLICKYNIGENKVEAIELRYNTDGTILVSTNHSPEIVDIGITDNIIETVNEMKRWLLKANLLGMSNISIIQNNTNYYFKYLVKDIERNDLVCTLCDLVTRNYLGYGYLEFGTGEKTDTGFIFLDMFKHSDNLAYISTKADLLREILILNNVTLDEISKRGSNKLSDQFIYGYNYNTISGTTKKQFRFVDVPLEYNTVSLEQLGFNSSILRG